MLAPCCGDAHWDASLEWPSGELELPQPTSPCGRRRHSTMPGAEDRPGLLDGIEGGSQRGLGAGSREICEIPSAGCRTGSCQRHTNAKCWAVISPSQASPALESACP